MKVCGIIAEYNPFHNGHKYQIDFTRRELSCDYIIAVISGNFVQRGAPAVIDKYYRTRMALSGGADIVIELPTFYALQSAQYFALGGVSLLDGLGIINNISYGSESYEKPASEIIDFISKIPPEKKEAIEESMGKYLIQGNSYPLSYAKCLSDYLTSNSFDKKDVSDTLSQPNTILELMYLEALATLSSDIQPFKVARRGAQYHDKVMSGTISSATAIRRSLGKNSMYLDSVTSSCAKLIQSALNETNGPITAERYFKTFLYSTAKNEKGLSVLADISGGLDMRMIKKLNSSSNMDEYIKAVKSKSYTYVRIARTIFNYILGIDASDTRLIRKDLPMYARVLGLKKEASFLIDMMHEKANIPVFTQTAKFEPKTDAQKRLFEIDINASDIYNIHANMPYNKGSDYTNQVIVI
ncbi:MAG: nucleotidyltransferase family protein [Clostridiales bacterium]|nr:nucleotidyltransferase family protein [Clostridiales bacterium]